MNDKLVKKGAIKISKTFRIVDKSGQ